MNIIAPLLFNPLTLISDKDKISPFNINTISTRQVMRKKITCTYIVRNVWQTIRIINREILVAKGLKIIPKEEINLSNNELFPLV